MRHAISAIYTRSDATDRSEGVVTLPARQARAGLNACLRASCDGGAGGCVAQREHGSNILPRRILCKSPDPCCEKSACGSGTFCARAQQELTYKYIELFCASHEKTADPLALRAPHRFADLGQLAPGSRLRPIALGDLATGAVGPRSTHAQLNNSASSCVTGACVPARFRRSGRGLLARASGRSLSAGRLE